MLKKYRSFLPVIRPMLPMAAVGLLLATVTAFAQIALLAVSGWFIAAMALAGAAGLAMNYFSPAAIIRGLAITRTAGRYAERLSTHDAALRFVAALRPWVFARICAMPAAEHDRMHSGSMFDMLRGDIDHLEKFYLNGFVPLFVALGGVFSAAVLLAFYQPALALILFLLLVLFGVALPNLFWRRTRGAARMTAARGVALRTAAVDVVDGMGELLVYGRALEKLQALSDEQEGYIDQQRRLQDAEAAGAALQGFLVSAMAFGFFAAALWLYFHADAGAFHPAQLAALPLLVIACADVLAPVSAAFHAWEAAGYALDRMRAVTIFDATQEMKYERSTALLFEHVTFRHEGAQAMTLSDISFCLQAGECMAIAGASGSGKSTLIDIIAGVRSPEAGRVQGGGLGTVSVAEQRPYVFAGTIRSNLLLGNPDATEEEIAAACRAAAFDDVIESLPGGYGARLGNEGVASLSGGQMRRLSVARALLKKADYLVLDEPDDGLDAVQALTMIEGLKDFCRARGQGLIVVTHNATVIGQFDRSLYLEDGRVAPPPEDMDMLSFVRG